MEQLCVKIYLLIHVIENLYRHRNRMCIFLEVPNQFKASSGKTKLLVMNFQFPSTEVALLLCFALFHF
jgi:hypothetical protein